MNEKYIHILSIAIIAAGYIFIGFLYLSEPKSFAEVASKGQVAVGTYSIDTVEFDNGLKHFRAENFPAARSAFERADREKRDAATQFYIAYSFYREGWGRLTNDDALFTEGLKAVDRAIAIDPKYVSTDPNLTLRTSDELRNELAEGLTVTLSDFNPLKLTRERK